MRGWVRIFSYTEPRENIITYRPWFIRKPGGDWIEKLVADGRRHGKGVVAQLAGCTDRDAAHAFIGNEIAVRREQLPDTQSGEYYWNDLMGLQVLNTRDENLGTVDHLLETGANDVLVLKGERERLVPFVLEQVVLQVDLENAVIRVDWDKDF